MMTDKELEELEAVLSEALFAIASAKRAMRLKEFYRASVFVGNVQNILPNVRQKLARQP